MNTKKYLERLLKDEAVLCGDVTQFTYRKVDLNIDDAVWFAETMALNVLVKLSKLAKLFETYYAKALSCDTGLIYLFRRCRLNKGYQFWVSFGTEIAKIRTKRLLEAMTRDGRLHVRRSNLVFNVEAATAYYLSLDEERRLLLLGNVCKKADNSFRLFQENQNSGSIGSVDMENYKNSALFWSDVWEVLSSIKVAA